MDDQQKINDDYTLEWQAFIHKLIKVYYAELNNGEYDKSEIREIYQDLMKTSYQREYYVYDIRDRLQLNDQLFFFVMLSFVYEFDSKLRSFCSTNFGLNDLTFEIGFILLQYVQDIHFSDIFQLLEKENMKMLFKEDYANYLLYNKICLQPWVVRFLECGGFDNHYGIHYYHKEEEFLPILNLEFENISKLIDSNTNFVIQGNDGCGKKALIKRYANTNESILQFIDMQYYQSLSNLDKDSFQRQIYFFNLMNSSVNVLLSADFDKQMISSLTSYLSNLNMNYIILSSKSIDMNLPTVNLSEYLNYDDMKLMISYYDLPDSLLEYHYSVNELLKMISGYCVSKTSMAISNLYVEQVTATYEREDYICSDETFEMIDIMLYEMKHRKQIHHKFKNKKTLQGVQLLFHGPSGCGKTMLASVLASELNVPLYKIDLSMVVDKYIGESEKHLAEIFKQAEKENCILLFDEADVLFAKRTEVNSSNDRNANTITAYLLQRIENYDGIVILTSNMINNFDVAFMRRIHFIIRLGKPNQEMLKRKWLQMFEQLELDSIDLLNEVLKFSNLTLAEIEKIMFHAYGIALKEGTQINQTHIQKAYYLEKQKTGIVMEVKE